MKRIILQVLVFSFFSILISSCYEEIDLLPDVIDKENWIFIDDSRIFFDNENRMALLAVNEFDEFEGKLKFPENYELKINGVSVFNGQEYEFEEINNKSSFSIELVKENGKIENYTLEFTLLPILEISHNFPEIPNDSKIIASFFLFDPIDNDHYEEYCGIETRGGSANAYQKKSYGIEFNKISSLDEEKNVSILGMPEEDDWILDASFIDRSNMRNRVSFEVWKDIQTEAISNGRNTLMSSTEGKFVELFINSEYRGLYCICEYVDGKRLGLNELENPGYLYKSEDWSPSTTYSGLPDTLDYNGRWSGWEQKFPDSDLLSIWKPLYEFVEFIIASSDEDFMNNIDDYLEIDQAIDFFILVNLIQGNDNAGKNIFLTKTSISQAFYISPWDMDASWGRNWQAYETTVNGIVTFKIFDRLMAQNPNNYRDRMEGRWEELRSNVLAFEKIIEKFNHHYEEMTSSGAARREFQKWPESLPEIENELLYLDTWINGRLTVLDAYFDNL